MKKIILDTNFLLIPSQFKVDIFDEISRICHFPYQLCILDKTIDELDSIILSQSIRYRIHARIAKKLIKSYNIKTIATEKSASVDSLILSFADKKEHIVATQDAALKSLLKQKGIPIIFLRKKQFLMLSH